MGLQPAPLAALNQARVDTSFPNTTSVLVLKDGKLVFERHFGGGGPDVLHDARFVGQRRSHIVYAPSRELVAVVTRRHYNQRGMHQQTLRLLEDHVLASLTCSPSRDR